jgi:DNA-binding MarR family transcriptional regulator
MVAAERDPIDEAERQWIAHGWEDAASGMAAVTTIVRVNQLLLGRIDRLLRPHELSFARFEVLRLLAFTRVGGLPMGKLGELLQVHPASVTNAVERLECDGLARRTPNPRDSRSTIAEITPAGRRRVERATVDMNAFFTEVGAQPGLRRVCRDLNGIGARGAAF